MAGNVLGSTDDYHLGGTVEGVEDVTIDANEGPSAGERVANAIRRYVAVVLIGGLALLLAPRALRISALTLRERPLPSGLTGLVVIAGYVPAMPALVIPLELLALSFGLLRLGGLVLTSAVGLLLGGGLRTYCVIVAAAFLTVVVVGLMIGRPALSQARTHSPVWSFGALLLGVPVVVALTELPVLRFIFSIITVLLGIGALAFTVWQCRHGSEPVTA